jgi:hypothetical protein
MSVNCSSDMEVDGDNDGLDCGGDDDSMTHPPAAMAKPAHKETNAFQAAGPLMKEHLGLLELSETKESKIAHVVNFFSDLIISEKGDQLEKAGVNSNKGQTFISVKSLMTSVDGSKSPPKEEQPNLCSTAAKSSLVTCKLTL